MTDLTKYQTDHLILLVGSNPLPNWVATHLLWRKTKEENRLFFVHSADTHAAAKRLRDLLMKQNGDLDKDHDFRFIRVEEADAGDIYTQLKNQIPREALSGDIGLNYTGGTKVMAVQAHKAIADIVAGRKLVCSYLDARTYEMRFDPPEHLGNTKILTKVTLQLEDLLALHDIDLKPNLPNRAVILPSSTQALAKIHASKNAAQNWNEWCMGEFGKARDELDGEKIDTIFNRYKKEEQLEQREAALEKVFITWPPEQKASLRPAVKTIQEELGLASATQVALPDVLGQNFSTMTDFCRWLKGLWLEYYVLDEITKIIDDCQLCDYGMSLDTLDIKGKPKSRPTDEDENKPNFEFDVATIRGYQLFGLSCTTDIRNSTVKHKLFEAYIRARQLGGDEARVAVVCPHAKPQHIRKEVEFDAPGKVEVFGAKHLPNLADHLKKWILGEQ